MDGIHIQRLQVSLYRDINTSIVDQSTDSTTSKSSRKQTDVLVQTRECRICVHDIVITSVNKEPKNKKLKSGVYLTKE